MNIADRKRDQIQGQISESVYRVNYGFLNRMPVPDLCVSLIPILFDEPLRAVATESKDSSLCVRKATVNLSLKISAISRALN